jgi:hypothetical protein
MKEEAEIINAKTAEITDALWRHFNEMRVFKGDKEAMGWWHETAEALSEFDWWPVVAKGMKGNITQLVNDKLKREEQMSSGVYVKNLDIHAESIGQMAVVSEKGSTQILNDNTPKA